MSETILIADDHPLLRQALALSVANAAPLARVIEAGTLNAAARAAAEADDLRLITLDLKMPGAIGYSGIALLHAEKPDVPILVVSSAEGALAADEARAFGAVGFLRKDADLSQIEDAMRAALNGTSAPGTSPDPVGREVAGRAIEIEKRKLTPGAARFSRILSQGRAGRLLKCG